MSHRSRLLATLFCLISVSLFSRVQAADEPAPKPIRVGIIGLDTSHVPAFAKILNDPKATGDLAGFRVVAGFPGGSPDVESSRTRVEKFTNDLRGMNVEIVDSIPKLLEKVDVVLLESVDGRPHLEQVRPVFAAGKPVFIDKPLAGSLAGAVAIAGLGRKHNVPWFSAKSYSGRHIDWRISIAVVVVALVGSRLPGSCETPTVSVPPYRSIRADAGPTTRQAAAKVQRRARRIRARSAGSRSGLRRATSIVVQPVSTRRWRSSALRRSRPASACSAMPPRSCRRW